MLVQRILDFIKSLEKEDKPISCDVKLRQYLTTRFSHRVTQEELNEDDIQELLLCYKTRWNAIVDGEDDYTRNASVVNLYWIDLARELESVANRSYLKILIPNLTNDKDLNNLSPLTETVNLFNFYLGYGGTTLFRKIGLCEHLQAQKFALSTYRSLTQQKLSPVSIDELVRLKLCKETSRQVSIGVESFANFWDLMRKKVFTRLSDHGQIPIGILPHLLELIEKYHTLKASESSFSLFKNEVKYFFLRLYAYEIAEVNSLYGAKIDYKEREEYLLDVFIALHTANDFFELDFEIRALSKWLFKFNPNLQALSKELESLYIDLTSDNLKVESSVSKPTDLENCGALLVSLFTTQFEFPIKNACSLWDKSNNLFPEGIAIVKKLLPLAAMNRTEALIEAYKDIIKDVIIPAKKDNSWFTWITRDEPTKKWLDLVQNGQLSKVHAYCFEPELIFSALLHFNTNNQSVRSRINAFLDDLIHTCTQDQNDLMRRLRVNILFTEFLSELSVHHRRNLLILIKLSDLKSANAKFLNNCTNYINDRLAQLSQTVAESGALQFFSHLRRLDSGKLFHLPEGIKDVDSMVVEYKKQLSSLALEPKLLEKVSVYLLKIGQPILTVEEREMTKSGRPNDYIGQYT